MPDAMIRTDALEAAVDTAWLGAAVLVFARLVTRVRRDGTLAHEG